MSSTTFARPKSADEITAEALSRYANTPDPRLKEIMLALTKHLHAFVKDVKLTEEEWFAGIKYLTDTGHMCSNMRQEFVLLSDVLGVSMVTDLLTNGKPTGATETTVFGPFHRDDPPERKAGETIMVHDRGGIPTFIYGKVLDMQGKPIANAALDVWQTSVDGIYDSQDDALGGEMNMRGLYHTDAEGNYLVKTTRPVAYQIPTDGPVGALLKATNRHPWRPAHTHFMLSAPGYDHCTTHLFDSTDKYLDSDAVFGVKDSLIVHFDQHEAGSETARKFGESGPVWTAHYDFVLAPARS